MNTFMPDDVVVLTRWVEDSSAFDGVPAGELGTVIESEDGPLPRDRTVRIRVAREAAFPFLDEGILEVSANNDDEPAECLRLATMDEIEEACEAERDAAGRRPY